MKPNRCSRDRNLEAFLGHLNVQGPKGVGPTGSPTEQLSTISLQMKTTVNKPHTEFLISFSTSSLKYVHTQKDL